MTTSKGFLVSGSGLFGKRNDSEGTSLADLAQSTQFPQWNTMMQKKAPRLEFKSRKTLQDLESYRKLAVEPIDQGKLFRDRRCSDTSLLERNLKQQETQFSPSHYKGSRRGTYAATYDPRVTQTRTRSDTRSRSLFIKAADEQLSNPDLRIQLLRTFHKQKETSDTRSSDSESSSITDDLNNAEVNRQRKHKCQKKHKSLKVPNSDNKIANSAINHFRQERAMSSFQNLSKQHVEYLQKKHQQQKNADRNTDSSNSTCSDDDVLPELHRAAKEGDIDKLSSLIDQGHDVNLVDNNNNLPCYYALLNGHFDCVALLVSQGADLQDYFARQRSKYFK